MIRRNSFFTRLLIGNLTLVILIFLLSRTAMHSWVILLISAIIAVVISWLGYAPLQHIFSVARQLHSGNLSVRANTGGAAELQVLSKVLNDMRKTVAHQVDTIRHQNENLRAILTNLREGVVAVNANGEVRFINSTARDFFNPPEDSVGHHVQHILRHPDLAVLHQNCLDTREDQLIQVELTVQAQSRVLQARAGLISDKAQADLAVLLVFRDITEAVRLAKLKSDFVANASHELRTPLATLRAAVDTLRDLPPNDTKAQSKFMDMLDRHVARLEAMSNDLLDLHSVEDAEQPSIREATSLQDVLEWAKDHVPLRTQKESLNLTFEANPPDAIVQLDVQRLRLILRNLLDNALKFTLPGGSIHVSLSLEDHTLILAVRDTGCGIGPEDQTRIFDRFYQVDAAKSGDNRMRGTGLGLAIVKHAAERLGATVHLDSTPGEGSCFTVRILVQPI